MEQMIASWSMVMVHGLMVVGPVIQPQLARSWGRGLAEAAVETGLNQSNVVVIQAGYLARPTTKAPETRFIL